MPPAENNPSSVSCVAALKTCQMLCLRARPRYNVVVDEVIKKPTNQTNKPNHDLVAMHFNKFNSITNEKNP